MADVREKAIEDLLITKQSKHLKFVFDLCSSLKEQTKTNLNVDQAGVPSLQTN